MMDDLDAHCPGGVYLCQVSNDISCGACCGLYNVADPSFESLNALLRKRTDLFEKTARDYDSLVKFKTIIDASENQIRPYPEFHHCPYIGLVGDNRSRPGCLLHPLGKGNNRIDHRGLSDWGGFACASYFCPTCSELPVRYKKILRHCASNWYLFGLLVTESGYLSCYFSHVETLLNKHLEPEQALSNSRFTDAVTRFFNLKITWPYRPEHDNRLGNYFFKDNLYPRTAIPYDTFQTPVSDLDAIFTALGSEFRSKTELDHAEKILRDLIALAASL